MYMGGFLARFKKGDERKEVYIKDFITGALVKPSDDVLRKQFVAKSLVLELGYPKNLIDVDVDIKLDGKVVGRADLVVYRDEGVRDPIGNSYILIVVGEDGLERLRNLMSTSKAEYGLWSDGTNLVVLRRNVDGVVEEVVGLPRYGLSFDSLNKPMLVSDLSPTSDLKTRIDGFFKYLKQNEKLDDDELLDELLKLVLMKVVDESLGGTTRLWISNDEYLNVIKGIGGEGLKGRVNELLNNLTPYGFSGDLAISARSIAEFIRRFNYISILKSDDLTKVESLLSVSREFMSIERGGILTPYVVAELMIKLVKPSIRDLIIDPACGSGRLITYTLKYLRDSYGLSREDLIKLLRSNILCVDVSASAIKLASVNIALHAGVPGNVFKADSLTRFSELQELAVKASIPEHLIPRPEGFDVVITHPPFNVRWRVRDPKVLSQFELGFRWDFDRKASRWFKSSGLLKEQLVEVLFIERGFQLLKPYGRMAILLPEELLAEGSLGYVRQWIVENARVLAVVSLPHPTLIAYGLKARAFVLVLQKVPKDRIEELRKSEYKVFVASVERVGYDALGIPMYKRDKDGRVLLDESGSPILDTDIENVIRAYNEYLEKEGISLKG